MNRKSDLSTKRCIPCHDGVPKLEHAESLTYLKAI